jgi:uncharacterized membrane protein
MENRNKKLLLTIYTALAIALVALSTLSIRIPTIKGYINFGDIMIFVTAATLGRKSGFIAGAVGSALADVIGGYIIYAPGTFIIKGLEGLICALLIRRNLKNKPTVSSLIIASIISGIWMVLGYFLYESLTFGVTTAIPSIPGNLVQGGVSAFAAVPIIIALSMARLSINIDK